MRRSVVAVLAVAGSTAAFVSPVLPVRRGAVAAVGTARWQPVAGLRPARSPALRMQETAETQEEAAPASDALEGLKGDLMTQLSVGSGLKGAADSANRAEINELVLKLEAMNPAESAASSPLLNGVWELLYTGGYGMGFFDSPTREIALALYTGGFRPSLFANLIGKLPGPLATLVELDDVELTIKRDQPRVQATARVALAGNEQTLRLIGELESPSAVRLQETLVKAELFGQSTDLQGPLRTRRSLFATFLDDDVLVVRDETGVPDIWLRKEKDFLSQESSKVDASLPETFKTKEEFKVDPTKDIEPGWVNELSEDVGPSDY